MPGSTVCGAKGGLRSLPVTEVAGKSDRFMLRRGVAWRPTFAGVVVAVDDDSPPRKLEPVALAFLIELLDEAGSKGVAFDQLFTSLEAPSDWLREALTTLIDMEVVCQAGSPPS